MIVAGGSLRVSGGLFLSFSYLRETTSSSPKKRAVVVMMAAATAEARAEAREVVARVEVNEVKRVAVKAAMAEAVYGVDSAAKVTVGAATAKTMEVMTTLETTAGIAKAVMAMEKAAEEMKPMVMVLLTAVEWFRWQRRQ
jgi:hypothetical protein